jgi:hypothetical protein
MSEVEEEVASSKQQARSKSQRADMTFDVYAFRQLSRVEAAAARRQEEN